MGMSDNDYTGSYNQPDQRIAESSKTDKWYKDNLKYLTEAYSGTGAYFDSYRKSYKAMLSNYNLLLGETDAADLIAANNPANLQGKKADILDRHNDSVIIINPTINTLEGEALSREHILRPFVINEEAVTTKERELDKLIDEAVMELINPDKVSKEMLEEETIRLQEQIAYNFQASVEKTVFQLYNDAYHKDNLKMEYYKGFQHKLRVAEEVYAYRFIGEDVYLEAVHPLTFYRRGATNIIEESEEIVEKVRLTRGDIVARFGGELSKSDIARLYPPSNKTKGGIHYGDNGYMGMYPLNRDVSEEEKFMNEVIHNQLGAGMRDDNNHLEVLYCFWRGLRKVKLLSYPDEETGLMLSEIVDGEYEEDIMLGETSEIKWVQQWYQGTVINLHNTPFSSDNKDSYIFLDYKTCPPLIDMSNPYVSYPPYVGMINNIGDMKARSLVDELKPIQAKWSLFERKQQQLWARNIGKIVEIDVAKIPQFDLGIKGNLDIVFDMLKNQGYLLKDSNMKAPNGSIVGTANSALNTADLSIYSEIKNIIDYMNWLRSLADDVAGVNPQRRGEGSPSEGLGVTEERITRSTHQTMGHFKTHDDVVRKASERLVEYKRYVYSKNNKRKVYVLDDMTSKAIELTEDFKIANFGIAMMDGAKQRKVEVEFATYSEYAMNAGLDISFLLDTMMVDDIRTKVSKLRSAYREKQVNEARMQEQQAAMAQELAAREEAARKEAMQHELLLLQMKLDSEERKTAMKLDAEEARNNMSIYADITKDDNRNGIEDHIELSKQELVNEANMQKLEHDSRERNKDRLLEERLAKAKLQVETRKINNTKTSK